MRYANTLAGAVAMFALAAAHPRTPDAPGEWAVVKPKDSAGFAIYVDRSSVVRLPLALLVDTFFVYSNANVYSRLLFSCQTALTSVGYNGLRRKGGAEMALEWIPKVSPDGWRGSPAEKQLISYLKKQCAVASNQSRLTYWHPVTYSDANYFSVDIESVQVRGDLRTFWERSVPVQLDAIQNGQIARPLQGPVVRTQFETDCARRTSRVLAVVEDGKAVESFNSTHKPHVPDTIGSFVARFVCDI